MMPKWMEDTDEGTWVGHWIQALAFFWLGFLPVWFLTFSLSASAFAGLIAATGPFAHREASNFRDAVKEYCFRIAVRKKLLDGWMDLTAAFLAAFTDTLTWELGIEGFLVGVIGSAVFLGVVVLFRRNTKRKGR